MPGNEPGFHRQVLGIWDQKGRNHVVAMSGLRAPVSERPYKNAWSVEDALAEISEWADRQFDPRLVDLFVALKRIVATLREKRQPEVSFEKEAG